MLVAGKPLSPGAIFGPGFDAVNVGCTLREAGVTMAVVCNISKRSPDDCRFDYFERLFKDSGWCVFRGSSRGYKTGWVWFVVIHRPCVGIDTLRRLKFDGSQQSPATNRWTSELERELQVLTEQVDVLKMEMQQAQHNSPEWIRSFEQSRVKQKRRDELAGLKRART
jgi:hypothetical protein